MSAQTTQFAPDESLREEGRRSKEFPERDASAVPSSSEKSIAARVSNMVRANSAQAARWTLRHSMTGTAPAEEGEEDDDEAEGRTSSMKQKATHMSFPSHYSQQRRMVAHIMEHQFTDGVVAFVILFNFLLVCLDTDAHVHAVPHRMLAAVASEGGSETGTPEPSEDGEPPLWVAWGMQLCFIFFFLEMVLKMYIDQSTYLRNPWNRFDLFLISFGTFETIAKINHFHFKGMGAIRLLDLGRLMRLLKVLRLFTIFKELRRLMTMFAGCFRTIIWSFLLLVGVMTLWACVAVELLHPIVLEIYADTPIWAGHYRAHRSFASVFNANITLWQTIVASDSWGFIAIPVIERKPWTAFIFAGALLTLVFGVLNVIVVVMVDSCAEARARDFMNNALDIEEEERHQKRVLSKMFRMIDDDGSGSVTWEELKEGSVNVEEFKHWLRVMDVDEEDLQQLFGIVDADGSGFIDHDEFTEAMYRLKNAESRTTTKLIKFLVTRMEQKQHEMEAKQAETQAELSVVRADLTRVTTEHLNNLRHFVSQSHEAIAAKVSREDQTVVQQMESAVVRALDLTLAERLQVVVAELQGLVANAAALGPKRVDQALELSPPKFGYGSRDKGDYISVWDRPATSGALSIEKALEKSRATRSDKGKPAPTLAPAPARAAADATQPRSLGLDPPVLDWGAPGNSPPSPPPISSRVGAGGQLGPTADPQGRAGGRGPMR